MCLLSFQIDKKPFMHSLTTNNISHITKEKNYPYYTFYAYTHMSYSLEVNTALFPVSSYDS